MLVSTTSKALITTLIPFSACCYAIGKWFIFRNRTTSHSSTAHSVQEEIQQHVSGPHSITLIIFRRTTSVTDEESGIPLSDMPLVAQPSSIIVCYDQLEVPPISTITPPMPPTTSPQSSDSFKSFNNIWTGSIPSPTAHRDSHLHHHCHYIILPISSNRHATNWQLLADNKESQRFSINWLRTVKISGEKESWYMQAVSGHGKTVYSDFYGD